MPAAANPDFEQYAIYRLRLRSAMHLFLLLREVECGTAQFADFPLGEASELGDTLHTAAFGWLASLVDEHTSAVNVVPVWLRLFPSRAAEIESVTTAFAPCARALTLFRSEVAFHGNKSLARHLRASEAIRNSAFVRPTQDFLGLAQALVEDEPSVPGLREYLSELGL
jgi:hypothetical protein